MRIKTFQWVICALIAGLVLNGVAFAFIVEQNRLLVDQWFWIKDVLMPYRMGEISLFQALTWEFEILSHSHIFTLGSMIINERFFDFNIRLYTLIGTTSLLLCFYIFLRYLQKNENLYCAKNTIEETEKLSLNSQMVWTWGLLLLCTSALFNIVPIAAYWNSLVLFEFIYLAISLAYLYAFQKFIRENRILPLAIAMALTLLFGDAMGNAAVLSSLVMLLILTLFDRSYLKPTLILYAVFIGLHFLYKTYFTGQIDHLTLENLIAPTQEAFDKLPKSARQNANILKDVDKDETFTRYFVMGKHTLANLKSASFAALNLASKGFLLHNYPIKSLLLFGGIISFSFTTIVSVLTLFRKRVRDNIFPFSLIGFSLICIIGSILLRLNLLSEDAIAHDRYYKFLIMLNLGSVFLLFDIWKQTKRAYLTYLFVGFLGLHVGNTVLSAPAAWASIAAIDEENATLNKKLGEFVRKENNDYRTMDMNCIFSDYCRVASDYLYSYDILPGVDNPDID